MASDLDLLVVEDTVGSAPLVEAAVRLVEHLEARWSRFRVDSDISRMNRVGASGGGVVGVDPSTLELLEVMRSGYERTSGRYDPTMLRVLLDLGYEASVEDPRVICSVPAGESSDAGALYDLRIDVEVPSVVVPDGLVLDPGGVGKGFAADLVVDMLLARGASGALVSIGGDLACAGVAPEPTGWLVDVEPPDRPGAVFARLAIDGGGVATSSVRSRRWMTSAGERHHQIDAVTGACSDTDLDAVTVVARSGWLAEVHATGALAVGSAGVLGYLAGHGLSGIAHLAGGGVLTSPDLVVPVLEPLEVVP